MNRALAAYAQQSLPVDEAELLRRYGKLVTHAARRLATRTGHPELADDLWSAGALGLLDAAGRFDGERGFRFETFAEHRIRGAMLDELRRMDHLPRRLRQKTDAVARASEQLAESLGRSAEPSEIAARTGLEAAEIEELQALTRPLLPLETAAALANASPDALEVAERRQLEARLARAVAALPERLQTLLSLHYVDGLTYREIAHVLEVSEPRICQLHAQAVRALREALAGSAPESVSGDTSHKHSSKPIG